MSLTTEFRDAYEDTEYSLINLDGLLTALHDIATENEAVCNSNDESLALMAVLNSAREKTREAMIQHSAEWEVVKCGQSLQVEAKA